MDEKMNENAADTDLAWVCSNCGSNNRADESACWKCGLPRTANSLPFDYTSKNSFTESSKPLYLTFLRIFAGINAVIGFFALIIFLFQFWAFLNDARSTYGNYLIISFPIAISGLVTFGVLNALADIAENMISVGKYVRSLRKGDSK